jgi:GntR family transcriptional regulator
MDQINRYLKIPFYQQIYTILRNKILSGDWKPGDLIPAESELIAQYQVSRNTIRDVMDMLVNDGLIYRQQGRGSFVSQPSMEQGLGRIINFTEDMRQRELEPSSVVLSAELLPAPEEIAWKLKVSTGEELGVLRRLRLANGEPISVEESYIIHNCCRGYLTLHDYSTTSLRDALVQDYGIAWQRAKQTIRAMNAPRELAHILNIDYRSALLLIERVSYTSQEIPVEFLRIYYRGDRYLLFNELQHA